MIALNNIDNPYLLSVNDFQKEDFSHNSVKMNKYIYRLSLLCDKSFYLAKLYSNSRSKDFENSTQAIEYFKSIEHLKNKTRSVYQGLFLQHQNQNYLRKRE